MPGAAPPLPQSVVFNTFASYAFPVVAVVVSSYSPCPQCAKLEHHAEKFRHRTAVLILL